MYGIRSKDFRHYEEQAAYFKYTHNEDDGSMMSDTYLCLRPRVIEAVQKKAEIDRQKKIMMGTRDLEKFLLEEKLLKASEIEEVLDDLYKDYETFFTI